MPSSRQHEEAAPPATRWFVLGPLAFLAGFAALRLAVPETIPRLLKEDGALEYLQVLLYAAAAVLAFLIALRASTPTVRWGFVLFGLGCAFVALEEVSWGERILGFEPPEAIRGLNTQDEMTLHNLAPFQNYLQFAYILAGLAGGLGWRVMESLPHGRLRRNLVAILPDGATMLLFLPVVVFYAYMVLAGFPTQGWLRSQDQEVFETLFAGGCAAFPWLRLRHSLRAAP